MKHLSKHMAEKNYSKRELDAHFSELTEFLTRIETQVTKTNGRVTALEKWMWMVIGGLSLLTFIQVAANVITKIAE